MIPYFHHGMLRFLKLADKIGVNETVPRKTSLQRNRSSTPSSTPQEHYKKVVGIPLLDSLLTQLRQRFRGEDNKYTQALLTLIPSVLLGLNDDQVLSAEHFIFWNQDLPIPTSLAGELERWKRLWSNVDDSETIPYNFVQAIGACDADSYRNIHCLLLIGCTLPITKC